MGLQDFLSFSVQALERLLDFPMVHVVVGNEACDLDSAVSAIAYAYYLHETSSAPVGTALFLPLLNIPRSDFPLRTEIAYFLGKFNITASDLIFRDDLDLTAVKGKTDLKLTLVDHHVLSGAMMDFEGNVVQILDHRPKDGDLPDRCESTLELVGSCSTLVTEVLLADETFVMDPVCTTLLYGAIVTDTINFSPAAGKATSKDLDCAERLEDVVEGGIDRNSLFEEIKSAKFDLSGLTSKEILQKDLKMVSGDSLMVAMSSVTMDMKMLMERGDFGDSLKSFAAENKVDAVVVLTLCSGPDDEVTRQLGVYSHSRVYRQQMADVLSASHSPSLGLSPLHCELDQFLPFQQSNVKASRKQILPIVKAFLAGETTPDESQMDAYDIPKDQSEGFTSMSSIVGSRQNTSDVEITSEDLTSRDDSSEAELSPDENLLQTDHKVFDPLSSVHSSDSGATSPADANKNAEGQNMRQQLSASEEIDFDSLSQPSRTVGDDPMEMSEGDVAVAQNPTFRVDNERVGDEAEKSGDGSEGALTSPEQNPSPFSTSPQPLPNNPALVPNQQDASWDLNNLAGHNQNNADPSQHNGLEEEDALEQDILNMASPHDLLFPTDSPLDISAATSGQASGQTSGQTSGHASKAPSYPVTPPNSYMDDGVIDKEVQLPSFNSSEMVEKIQEKKAALGASGSEEMDPMSPFTPQNSYVDTAFPVPQAKETQLPSFHSSDMVERIREKRSSMERDVQGVGAEMDTLLEAVRSPFTPHNSFVEGGFDKYAHENLPSLNNAEIANKIKQKQAELTAAAGQDSGTASPVGVDSSLSPAAPYTPQNSFRESHLDALSLDSHLTDLNEVAERLSLTGSESSGSLNEPKSVKASNRVHMQGLSPQEAASFPISEMDESAEASSQVSSVSDERNSNVNMNSASMGVKRKGVSFSQDQDTNSAIAEEAIQKIAYELANEMIQKALETFPSESVKELVPPEASGREKMTHPSISEDSSPTMDESDQDLSSGFSPGRAGAEAGTPDSDLASSIESDQLAAHFAEPVASSMKMSSSLADELAQALNKSPADDVGDDAVDVSPQRLSASESSVPKSESYEIETEYLSDMDPMQKMGVFHPEANVIETDADKEVVEGASFRKISGQEYQTVQEDILEQIRQEAKEREDAKRRHSSVAEEHDVKKDEPVTDDEGTAAAAAEHSQEPSEDRKKIAPEADLDLDDSLTDEQGKKTIHVVRDRELYASALENECAVMETPCERTLQPSDTSHPLLDPTQEECGAEESFKKKISATDSSVLEGHHYESFAEAGDMENAEERAGESRQGKKIERKTSVARTVSAASDISLSSSVRGAGAELHDEWQDDELPKILGEEGQPLAGDPEELGATAGDTERKRLVPDHGLLKDGEKLENVQVVDSDSEIDSDMDNEQLEWENDTPVQTPAKPVVEPEEIPQYTAAEERRDALSWKMINVGDGEQFRLDMRVIEPYKRVLSHGGYCGEGLTAMIVFSACYLPSRDRRDYSYVMNHLFHYVIHTLDELVADDYMIVYFHGATPRRQMPSFSWLKKCYQGIDRRLKKNLKALYLVHPTLWLKTVVIMTRPFISAKFSSKLQFVRTLADLKRLIPMEYVYIPEIVQRYDDRHFHPTSPSPSSSSPSPVQQ